MKKSHQVFSASSVKVLLFLIAFGIVGIFASQKAYCGVLSVCFNVPKVTLPPGITFVHSKSVRFVPNSVQFPNFGVWKFSGSKANMTFTVSYGLKKVLFGGPVKDVQPLVDFTVNGHSMKLILFNGTAIIPADKLSQSGPNHISVTLSPKSQADLDLSGVIFYTTTKPLGNL